MRPTVIHLIAGGALGFAFSVSLMLPGALVFPEDEPVRHFASPRVRAATVVRATPDLQRTPKAPAPVPQRVAVRRVYVPAPRRVPAAGVGRHVPARSAASPKPRGPRPTPPAEQRLTPLAATPSQPARAEKPKKAKKPKKEEQRSREKEKQRGKERGKERGKDKEKGEEKVKDKDKGDVGEGEKDKGAGDDGGGDRGRNRDEG